MPNSIPLRPFNVLIGRNGSGKSTLIEALQWLDTTIRRDAHEACQRYWGIHDLVNLRSRSAIPYFALTLTWAWEGTYRYRVKVEEEKSMPFIAEEELHTLSDAGRQQAKFINTIQRGHRLVYPLGDTDANHTLSHFDPERLAIATVPVAQVETTSSPFADLRDFWKRAVFLRLSPNRLADGSPAVRKSFEALLDEEGQNLPALISELTNDQRAELVENIRGILPGIRDVSVSEAPIRRDTRVNYSLMERMPYRGRTGRSEFPIPAWMLSEGTRRITAVLALLSHDPPPSLLCIEEIDNGLDPWTVLEILKHLQSAVDRGTQVILTTHSPWLLDHVDIDAILQVRRHEGETLYEHFASQDEILRFSQSVPAGTRYVNQEM